MTRRSMRTLSGTEFLVLSLGLLILASPSVSAQETSTAEAYFPPRGEWEKRKPGEVGMDAALLEEAVRFAKENETDTGDSMASWVKRTLGNEPHGEVVGPTRDRGAMNGLVVRKGYIVAEWGPTRRVDMTFSVTKTYLSTVVGLAVDRGLIRDVKDKVKDYVPTDHFESEQGKKINWNHLLRQTSDWRGTLWGKPGWADRPPRGATLEEMKSVPLREPGSAWEYNDVRVNLLALAALHVHRRPLPQVLREEVMDPIGASNTWRWHGYESSWITLDGMKVQSVSGGGHWGGGMFVNSRDHARFGYLFLRKGRYRDRRIISEDWIRAARTPTKANPGYGYMNWFLNTPQERRGQMRRPLPSAPVTAVTFRGAGSNIVYVDWKNDLVVVVRWIKGRALDGFIGRVLKALRPS